MEEAREKRGRGAVGGVLVLTLMASGCGSRGESRLRTVEKTRVVAVADGGFRWHATRAERFGLRRPGPARSAEFGYAVPEDWLEIAPTSMRAANFLVAGDPETECYATLLAGAGGGALANANRWRGQLGEPSYSPAEYEGLPRVAMLGGEGSIVEAVGTFSAGDRKIEDALLIGVVCILPDRAVFVKMIGPRAKVEPARADFLAFCRSLERKG